MSAHNASLQSFEDQIKSIGNCEILDISDDASVIFTIKDDDVDGESDLVDSFTNELFLQMFDPQKVVKNPCPQEVSYLEYRNNEMVQLNEHIYKKIIKEGNDEELNLEHQTVTYNYSMFLEHSKDPFDSSILNKKLEVVCVKSGKEPTPGCFLALDSMKNQEEAIFWISHSMMFGVLGCPPRIPPKADILFHAKILKIRDDRVDTDDTNAFKKMLSEQKANFKRTSDIFKLADYNGVISIYRKAIHTLENAHVTNEDDEKKRDALLAKIYLNLSICYNLINKPEKCCIFIRELEMLTSIEGNYKALYAKGKANMMLNHYERARKCFEMARELIPASVKIAEIIQELENREETKIKFDAEHLKLDEQVQAFFEKEEAGNEES